MKSELTIRNEVDTPALNQKLDALITLLSQQQSGGASTALPQQPIIIHPAAVHMDYQQIATIAFEKGDGRILDQKAADRYNQNAYKGGVRS